MVTTHLLQLPRGDLDSKKLLQPSIVVGRNKIKEILGRRPFLNRKSLGCQKRTMTDTIVELEQIRKKEKEGHPTIGLVKYLRRLGGGLSLPHFRFLLHELQLPTV